MFEIVCLCLHAIYVYSTYSICSFFKLNQAVLVGLAVWLLSSTPKYASIMYILFPCTFFYRVLLLWMFFYPFFCHVVAFIFADFFLLLAILWLCSIGHNSMCKCELFGQRSAYKIHKQTEHTFYVMCMCVVTQIVIFFPLLLVTTLDHLLFYFFAK